MGMVLDFSVTSYGRGVDPASTSMQIEGNEIIYEVIRKKRFAAT
jgi:hypothetical protein